MGTLLAWPFLVSRNQTVDYQPVVAPKFMVDNGIAALLVSKTGGERTSEPVHRKVRRTRAGDLTLIYRITEASDEQTSYKDGFGRSIDWVEGVVISGLKDEMAAPEVLERAHQSVIDKFKQFWVHKDKPQTVCVAPLQVTVKGQTLVLVDARPKPKPSGGVNPPVSPPVDRPLLKLAVATLLAGFIVASLTAAYYAYENRLLRSMIEVCQQENAALMPQTEGLYSGQEAPPSGVGESNCPAPGKTSNEAASGGQSR